MADITQIGRVMVPVSSQDDGIAFYTGKLGFALTADLPFGEGERWVEVTPPGGGAPVALVPSRGAFQAGMQTGIALGSTDPRGLHAELAAAGVDVDAELMGGDGMVPLLFMLRDHEGNGLMVVEDR